MVDHRTEALPGDREELNIADLWNTLVRNRWLVLGVTVAVVGLAALYTARKRPVYQSTATLAVDDDKANRNPLSDLVPFSGGSQGKLETDMVVLRSRSVAEEVVDSLHLTVRVVEPNLPRDQVLRTIRVPRDAPVGVYALERDGRAYTLRAEKRPPKAAPVRLPARVEAGVPFRVGGAELALAPALARPGAPDRVVFAIAPFRAAVSGMQTALVVSRADPKAKVLAVSYTTTDPVQAALVPNVLSQRFIDYKAALAKAESRNTVDFLRGQVAAYQRDLLGAENALRGFRESQRVVSPQEEAVQQVQRLATLQAERDRLRSEREALSKLLDRVSQGHREGQSSEYRQLASFPVFLSNKAVQDYLQSLTALENERAQELVRKTERNADVQGLDTRIREIELQLYQMARNYLEGLDTQLASTEAVLSRFGTQLEAIPAREVEFARLSRQQKLLDEIYSLLQTRLKEAEIREAAEPNDVRVIDTALVPELPISPRPFRNLLLGLMAGLVAGVTAAFAREALDTRVRTREDVQAATGQMPILGVIPRFESARGPAGTRRFSTADLGVSDSLVVRADPQSPAAEAFRALRTSIVFSGVRGAPQVLVVTSAMPGEGKSTSSSNLAITLAQQGSRTLLVDADLRRGTLHRIFDLPQEPGLTHVLLGMEPLEAAAREVEVAEGVTLSVLPAGAFPPNPAEILGSERMTRLLEELRGKFDAVIFDAPPLNLVTDATVLAKMVDAAVLVTRNGFTDKRALQHAATQLLQVHAPVSGVVLNDVDVTGGGRYYGYGYGYGYGYYGAELAGANGKNGRNGKNGKH